MANNPATGQRGQAERPLNVGVILRLGRRYLTAVKALALLYIIAYLLCQTVIPLYIARSVFTLTNYFNRNFSPQPTSAVVSSSPTPASSPAPSTPKEAKAPKPSPPQELSRKALVLTYAFWACLTFLLIVAGFGQRYISSLLAGKVSNNIRRDVFTRLLEQPSDFFHRHNADQLTLIVNQLCVQVQTALQTLLVDPILNVVGIVILGHELYARLAEGAQKTGGGAQVWEFFAAIVVVAVASPWLMARLGKPLQSRSRELQKEMLSIQSLVAGALNAPEEIQAMRAEAIFDEKHQAALDRILHTSLNQSLTLETVNAANRFPGTFVLISLLGVAVFIAVTGATAISGGVIILLFTLTPQFMMAVQGISAVSINASNNWPAVDAVDSLLSAEGVQVDEAKHDGQIVLEPTLEARDLVFSYPGTSKLILNHVSFNLAPRKVTGFIAKAGQGKTTFFRLLLRFYELNSGSILLGGKPHTSLPLDTLRHQVVLMHQSPAFFHDTIRENFRVANPAASDDEIRALCQKTPLWNILEDAYGSDPLDRPFLAAAALSGGQKKLFALTRCLLRNPSVLLLDEPTTGIDPEEKFELVGMMRQAAAGCTVLVVDHDIVGWQVLFCDYFVVLDSGKLVQTGSAGDLLTTPGVFKELFDKQAEGCHKMFKLIKEVQAQRGAGISDSSAMVES